MLAAAQRSLGRNSRPRSRGRGRPQIRLLSRCRIEITYLPQVAFQGKDSECWQWYLEEDLEPKILQTLGPGAGVKYFVTSQAELARPRSRLQGFGLPATTVVRHDRFQPGTRLTARVTAQFYSNLARCVAKIAFNYLAYATGEDTACLLRRDFDVIRNFVRQGFVYFSSNPRLDLEDRKGSFVHGHILVVGWDTHRLRKKANGDWCFRRCWTRQHR